MPKSDIFDRYAQIAESYGLIKNAKEEYSSSKDQPRPKAEPSTASDIEILYGLKPEDIKNKINEVFYGLNPNDYGLDPKEIQYEFNISELAHKNPIVVSPAHDKLNGLVENIKERQNIIINKLMKDPSHFDGHNHHKSAKQELIKELIKIANDMDNRDQEDLRILADSCVENINSIKKEALAPLAWAAGIGVSAILGYSIFINKTLPSDQGVKNNIKEAIEEIDDLTEDHGVLSFAYGQVSEQTKSNLIELKAKLRDLELAAVEYNNIDSDFGLKRISDIYQLKNPTILSQFKNNINIVNNYLEKIKEAHPLMVKCIQDLEWSKTHNNDKSNDSWVDSLKKVWHTVSTSDQEDVIRYLKTLSISCENAMQEALSIKKWSDQKAPEIESALNQMEHKSKEEKVAPKTQQFQSKPSEIKQELPKSIEKKPEIKEEKKPSFNAPDVSEAPPMNIS